ncbi:hypothetical protein L3049_07915 [Labilibaculum sp. DW002]|uniref:Uncharacterized protein n=1 Tax=Paralabilibaculum antarcticum TaxID=2912572 RepID=A0ABT5VRM2_9BACT|nr:hypothetical protein [Labilibaculum sp. DW002]MDE5417931.1 hypothetical protein [Labilibaculum sp. DW002]
MKKTIGSIVILAFTVAININHSINNSSSSNIDLASLISLNAYASGETGYSCTISTTCDTMGSNVECTGIKTCIKGWRYVKCDGNSTYC